MGLMNLIMGIFDKEVLWDEIIESQINFYNKEKSFNPDKDPHDWLASVYVTRYKFNGGGKEELDADAYSSTMIYSCLPEPNNARALGLYFIYKENRNILLKYPKYINEFNKLMENVMKLQDEDPVKFYELYKKMNPNANNL